MLTNIEKRVLELTEQQVETLIYLRSSHVPLGEVAKEMKVRKQVACEAAKFYADEIRERYIENLEQARQDSDLTKERELAYYLLLARRGFREFLSRDVKDLNTMQLARYLQMITGKIDKMTTDVYGKHESGISEEFTKTHKKYPAYEDQFLEEDIQQEEEIRQNGVDQQEGKTVHEEIVSEQGEEEHKPNGHIPKQMPDLSMLPKKEREEIEKIYEMEKWMDENPTKAVLPRLGIELD